MCWTSRTVPVKKVVKDSPLKVYKIFSLDDNTVGRLWSPIYYVHSWEVGKLYNTYMAEVEVEELSRAKLYFTIEDGYHSLTTKPYRDRLVRSENTPEVWKLPNKECHLMYYSIKHIVLECTLPIGTEYYENEYGEIVSNQLIINSDQNCIVLLLKFSIMNKFLIKKATKDPNPNNIIGLFYLPAYNGYLIDLSSGREVHLAPCYRTSECKKAKFTIISAPYESTCIDHHSKATITLTFINIKSNITGYTYKVPFHEGWIVSK